jgi:hypothetical protein
MRHALLLLAAALLSACTTWRPVESFDGWTLYAHEDVRADPEPWGAAYEPAHEVVEELFGPFERDVRVHVLQEDAPTPLGDEAVQMVPGIGAARVRAWHTRGDGLFTPPSGVYAGTPDAGTAAHELVHARLAEIDPHLPLWFEEGLACVVGDGILHQGKWIVDGYSCWPVHELRNEKLDDDELKKLLRVRAERDTDARDNVLVHFIGWAIVFDLFRMEGGLRQQEWRARYKDGIELREARERLNRSISSDIEAAWLQRLQHADPSVRLAASKGVWKLQSRDALEALVDRLELEQDPEVKASLAVNALSAAGETRSGRDIARRMWRQVSPALRTLELPDPAETKALRDLYRSFRWNADVSTRQALEGLRRYWAE